MATKTVTLVVCDRCNREVKGSDSADYDPEAEPAIIISRPDCSDITFTDLCPKCTKRVAALVADIALTASEKPAVSEELLGDDDENEDEDGDVQEDDDEEIAAAPPLEPTEESVLADLTDAASAPN